MAIEQFDWGNMTWLADGEQGNSRELSVAKMVLKVGAKSPVHRHSNCEEAIYVVAGQVNCRLADQEVSLTSGQVLVIPRGCPHGLINNGDENATLILTYASACRDYEAVVAAG